MTDTYRLRDGYYVSNTPVQHREDEYSSRGFDILSNMQQQHFWYQGRHRFLWHAVEQFALRPASCLRPPRVIDFGGGCGGWLAYFLERNRVPVAEIALADSSAYALKKSRSCLADHVDRYQVDLLDLQWHDRWDIAFLLDVLEHIPRQHQALHELHRAMAPGGLLFITTPALRCFWTWNDDVVGHQRRYSKTDYRQLAQECGFRLVDTRYFMFFLSFLLLAARRVQRLDTNMSSEELWKLQEQMHAVPHPVLNTILGLIFSSETPLGHLLPFPWGTSILAVLQKPA